MAGASILKVEVGRGDAWHRTVSRAHHSIQEGGADTHQLLVEEKIEASLSRKGRYAFSNLG